MKTNTTTVKLSLLILLTTMISTQTYSQEDTICDLNTAAELRNGILHRVGESNPYTGEMHCTFENGKDHSRGLYESGKKNGLFTFNYESGNVKKSIVYENGRGSEQEKTYYDDPDMSFLAVFKNQQGVRNGDAFYYRKNGKLSSICSISVGTFDGNCDYYADDGSISARLQMQKGLRSGQRTYWNKEGVLESDIMMLSSPKDKRVGVFYWHSRSVDDAIGITPWYKNGMGDIIRENLTKKYPYLMIPKTLTIRKDVDLHLVLREDNSVDTIQFYPGDEGRVVESKNAVIMAKKYINSETLERNVINLMESLEPKALDEATGIIGYEDTRDTKYLYDETDKDVKKVMISRPQEQDSQELE